MKLNNVLAYCTAAMMGLLSSGVLATPVTIEEVEEKRKIIMASDRSHEEKKNELLKLEELYTINQRLKALYEVEQSPESSQPEQKQETSAVKESVLQMQQGQRIEKMRELIANSDTGIYLTNIWSIGNDTSADLIVNGHEQPDVDIRKAIKSGRQFGSYKIVSTKDRSISVVNVNTSERKTIPVQNRTEILNRINYEKDVIREYAKSIVMGELEASLKKTASPTQSNLPLRVNYRTANPSNSVPTAN